MQANLRIALLGYIYAKTVLENCLTYRPNGLKNISGCLIRLPERFNIQEKDCHKQKNTGIFANAVITVLQRFQAA